LIQSLPQSQLKNDNQLITQKNNHCLTTT